MSPTVLEILEVGMLFCFGFAWPFNIYKAFKARSNEGKSLMFSVVIWTGYMFGILYKALSPKTDFVLWLYVINNIMVSIDIILYYRNKLLSNNKRR